MIVTWTSGGLAKRILGAGRRRHPGIVDPLDDAPVEGLWPLGFRLWAPG